MARKTKEVERLRLKVTALITKNKKILLVRNKGDLGFTLPGGGVESKEDVYDALTRELKEEIACKFNNPLFFDTYLGSLQEDGRHNFAFVFKIKLKCKPKKGKDVEEIKWFSVTDILSGKANNKSLANFIKRVKHKL